MKFTKTVVAVAVTGLFAVPMAASAETTLSGVIEIKYQGIVNNADDDPATPEDESAIPDEDVNLAAGDIRVAINSQQALTAGLTGYGNVQFNIDDLTGEGGQAEATIDTDPQSDDDNVEIGSSATVASDNIYVGVKGAFGDIRIGEIPTIIEYGQLANDIHDVSDTIVDAISYTGTFGPIGVGVSYSLEDDSDQAEVGIKGSFFGITLGAGYAQTGLSDNADNPTSGNFAVGAGYAIAGVSINAHYWLQEGDNEIDTDNDQQAVAVQLGYGIAGVNLGLTYSLLTTDLTEGDDGEESKIRLDAGYDLGGGLDLSTRITSTDTQPGDSGVDSDSVEYRVQLTKTF